VALVPGKVFPDRDSVNPSAAVYVRDSALSPPAGRPRARSLRIDVAHPANVGFSYLSTALARTGDTLSVVC
jgi:hypothetical protein